MPTSIKSWKSKNKWKKKNCVYFVFWHEFFRVLRLLLSNNCIMIVCLIAISALFVSFISSQPTEQYFTQNLDHFNGAERRTWQQRYFLNDSYFNPNLGGRLSIFAFIIIIYNFFCIHSLLRSYFHWNWRRR